MIHLDADEYGPSQLDFIECTDPFVGFFGGFGSGKSTALMMKLLMLKGANRTLPGLLMAQTFGALYSNIVEPMLALLEDWLPPRLVPRAVGIGGAKPHLRWADGTITHLRSAEHPKGYDGLTVAYLLGDEIRHWSRYAYEVAIARVRIKHAPLLQRAFASTPAMNWCNDEFNTDRPRRLIHAPTSENARNLPDDYEANLRASYSKRMQLAVLQGLFTILEGAVYEDFDPNPTGAWFVDYDPDPKRMGDARVFLAADPGYRRSAWLLIAEIDDLSWVVFDQLMGDNMTDSQCIAELNRRAWPIDEVWIDVAAGATQSFEGASTLTALRELRMRRKSAPRVLSGANREISFGVDKTRVLLGSADNNSGQPIRVKFARRLLRKKQARCIVRNVGSYAYPEHKPGRPMSDSPLKDGVNDHGNDALRYWAVGRHLCEPRLRRQDPSLARQQSPGWRHAA